MNLDAGSLEIEKKWKVYSSSLEAAKGSDAIVLLTEWDEFFKLELNEIYEIMRIPCWIFDTRNVINVEKAKKIGFNIWKLGDGNI